MRMMAGLGLVVLGVTGSTTPTLARENAPAITAQPQTFSIVLPQTHRATGRRGEMVRLASDQLQSKGYRPAARGQKPDLIVKLRFEDSYYTRAPLMLDEISPPGAALGPASALAPSPGYSASGEAFPYPGSDIRVGLGIPGRSKATGRRRMERVAPHNLYVGFSVATAAGNKLLHVKEVARQTDYTKVDEVGRAMIGEAVAGVPAAR